MNGKVPRKKRKTPKSLVKGKKPEGKTKEILKLATTRPGLTVREIGQKVGCGHSNVVRTLQRYGVDKPTVTAFKAQRQDICVGLQSRILQTITTRDIKKASLQQRITAYGILTDKEFMIKKYVDGGGDDSPIPAPVQVVIEVKDASGKDKG